MTVATDPGLDIPATPPEQAAIDVLREEGWPIPEGWHPWRSLRRRYPDVFNSKSEDEQP